MSNDTQQQFLPGTEPPAPPFDWETLQLTKCEKCTVPLCFGTNIDTGKSGPMDAKACVYIMRRDQAAKLRVQTFKNFMATVKSIEFTDGTRLDGPEALRAFVSHFATCPSADFFSRRAKS